MTGGGGSIGSELCRQVMRFKPAKLLIFDIYENCAYELLMELQQKYGRDVPVTVLVGSIRDKARLDEVFETYHPPVGVLPSLSRLMKDGIGEGFTRKDHSDVSNQLFAAYAKVQDARSLASVIGEDELSPIDKQYLAFGKEFEEKYIGQGPEENRTMEETLNLGWELLGRLPKEELDRVDTKILDKYYHPTIYDDTTTATSSPGSIANQN